MNLLQFVKQLKFLLQTAAWPDSPAGPVFAAVHVTQGSTDLVVEQYRYPLALIAVSDGSSDEQAPNLKTEAVTVTLAVANAGDQVGEFALIGGQRASQGRSQGRGLLEVEEQLRQVVNVLNANQGVRVLEVASSSADAAFTDGPGYVANRSYVLRATLTTARVYPAPAGGNALGVTKLSGTSLRVNWGTVVERFDAHQVYSVPALAVRGGLTLVRQTGHVPATVADGTTVLSTTTQAVTTFTDTGIGAGTIYYGLFYRFDEYGDGATSVRYSTTPAVSAGTVLP